MAQMAQIKSNHVWWKYALFHNFRDLDLDEIIAYSSFTVALNRHFGHLGHFGEPGQLWKKCCQDSETKKFIENQHETQMSHTVSNSKLLLYVFSKWYSKKGRKQNLIKGWGSLFIWKNILDQILYLKCSCKRWFFIHLLNGVNISVGN